MDPVLARCGVVHLDEQDRVAGGGVEDRAFDVARLVGVVGVFVVGEDLPPELGEFVIVPLVVIAGMLFELFREADGHKFVPVTMTGNLVRLVEATYATFVERRTDARPGFWMDVGVLGCYLTGALLASCVVKVAGERSIWVAVAGMLVLLALFVVDDLREG